MSTQRLVYICLNAGHVSIYYYLQLERDELARKEAVKKVQEKTQKSEAFEDQRHALMKELEDTRLEIAQHEAYLKVIPSTSASANTTVVTEAGRLSACSGKCVLPLHSLLVIECTVGCWQASCSCSPFHRTTVK